MIKAHWSYLKYVLRHKWFVFLECRKLGITWRGITHDLSKFRPSEWFPYVAKFYGADKISPIIKKWVQKACRLHYERNDHHWQSWRSCWDSSHFVAEMPYPAIKEMVADWSAMDRARGKGIESTQAWYKENMKDAPFSKDTRAMIEFLLGISKEKERDSWGAVADGLREVGRAAAAVGQSVRGLGVSAQEGFENVVEANKKFPDTRPPAYPKPTPPPLRVLRESEDGTE